jgi:prepilin-type N-terminal cleavage/methylation domain-containing protein
MQNRMKTERGFSLIELLVVVAIILIISAMALPNINNTLRVVRMKSTGTEIAGVFEQARMEAIKRNATAGLKVRNYVDANGRTRFYLDTNNNLSYDGPGAAIPEPMVILPQGYSIPAAPPAGLNLKYPGNLAPAVLAPEAEGTAPATVLGFNARGLPCTGTPCNSMTSNLAGTNFATYYTDGQRTGAIAIYQTGKTKIYVYDGTKYE